MIRTPWYQNVNYAFWLLVLILMADQLKSLLPRPRLSILPSIWEDHWVNYTSQSVYILLGDIVSVKLSWYMTYIWKNILCTFLPSIYPSKWIHRIQSWKKRECVAFLAWTLFCVARLLSPKLIKSMLFLRVGLIDLMSHWPETSCDPPYHKTDVYWPTETRHKSPLDRLPSVIYNSVCPPPTLASVDKDLRVKKFSYRFTLNCW